ncbi:hypothetical protein K457DRAFT_15904 [Linnemannia elongata AG-77]|uniref:Uncharacterized protein n=1 Tax=Linnemannia elongata AG-77 TaxID=1314771 RepID=A0A197K802_9FUNG|nr:hypothetical protein K457DRAFT_15904 [Linnemannia elongata AG-77]
MGILKFDCMTTDPAATTFYGITNTDRYGDSTAGGLYKNMVLAKSNANPSSVMNTNWSFLSSYSSKSLSIAGGIPTVAGCAVDSRGVVTFVAAHYPYDATKPYSAYSTALRYDPAGVANPDLSQGTGSWSTLALNPAFGQILIEKLSLWYTTVTGVETLNIALTDKPSPTRNDTVHFGTFDAATMTFHPTGKWVMDGVLLAALYRGDELYYLRYFDGSAKLDAGSQQQLAILQNTFYMICSKGFNEPLSTLAIIKDVTNANSKFEDGVPFTTTAVEISYFIPIGSSNNTAIGGRPIALIQDKQSYRTNKLQYSIALAAPALGSLEGPSDAIIPEKFGYDTAYTTYSAFPRPTGGSGSGGHNTGDDVAAVAIALPLKFKLLIAAGAIIVGGGIIYLLVKCCAGCYMISKDVIKGEVPSGAVTINTLAVPTKKEEKVASSGVGGRTYPVMTERQTSTSSPYGTPLSPVVAQDSGVSYLFSDTSANATQQSTILTIHETGVAASLKTPVLGRPPSLSIPRHSGPDA